MGIVLITEDKKMIKRQAVILTALLLISSIVLAAPKPIRNSQGMTFMPIPAGSFIMGTTDLDGVVFELPDADESLVKDETPPHKVSFAKGFYLGQTEVTQQQWLVVMGTKPGLDSFWRQKNWQNLPVVSISWNMAQAFVATLNKQDANYHYRLPTEAEWEYAARAGSQGMRPFAMGDDLKALHQHAWLLSNSNDEQHPVAQREPNAWGLYDTLGNAWEWVEDWYAADTYQTSKRMAKVVSPSSGTKRVRRGGSYHCKRHMVRPAYRAADLPNTAYTVLGFRVVAELKS